MNPAWLVLVKPLNTPAVAVSPEADEDDDDDDDDDVALLLVELLVVLAWANDVKNETAG